MRKFGLYKLILSLLLLLLGNFSHASENLKFQKGVLDLRGYSLDQLQEIEIVGEWEFYWDQLLESTDFSVENADSIQYIHVPSIWNKYEIDGEEIPIKGTATYRAIILLDTTNCELV